MKGENLMDNEKRTKLHGVVAKTFEISVQDVTDELAVGSIPQWDSLGHLGLITAIEEAFGVSFDVDELFEVETVGDFLKLLENEDC